MLCLRNFIFLIVILNGVQTARILGIFPIPSKSHQTVFTSLTTELAKKGHELVVVTTDPLKDNAPANVTEIDVSFAYGEIGAMFSKFKRHFRRGAIMGVNTMLETEDNEGLVDLIAQEFEVPDMKKILDDKNQKFDLIIVEGFHDYQLVISEFFDAPIVMICSFMGFPEHYDMVGAALPHPVYYPHFLRMNFHRDMSFWDIIKELHYEYKIYHFYKNQEEYQNEVLKKKFGPNTPTTKELRGKVDLLLLTVNPIFANNRPVPPNVVFLDALHLKPPKDLPQDLQAYMDISKRGVVYVSLGSNVRPSMMDKEFLDAFLLAFDALPYDILWKFDGSELKNVPENVKIMKWFPQQDILRHPNLKAFVTQCGIQSTSEAVSTAVPMVGIPMMAEQWFNAQKLEDLGIGVKLDPFTLNADDIVRGVNTVIENKSYKENVVRVSKIVSDNPLAPLERAVWWIEYVIRHGGAKHYRTPAANVTWTEYFMIDVVLKIVGIFVMILALVLLILYILVKRVLGLFQKKEKVKRK